MICATCLKKINSNSKDLNMLIIVGSDHNRENYFVCSECAESIREKGKEEAIRCIRENLKYLRGDEADLKKTGDKNSREVPGMPEDVRYEVPLF